MSNAARLAELVLTPNNEFQPHTPTPKQFAAIFAARHRRELLFGGAAGGGKSDLLLHLALSHVEQGAYSALIMRRKFSQLSKEGGLLPRSHEWLGPTRASWRGDQMKWTFPSGATLEFGHCQRENDRYDYDGSEFNFVGVDQLEQFTEAIYTYIAFSRMRRAPGGPPLCAASTANPGGVGGAFIKARFGIGRDADGAPLEIPDEKRGARIFVRSLLADNPHLDREEYVAGLEELDPLSQDRLLRGDWDAVEVGDFFDAAWFKVVRHATYPATVRFWDEASTKPHNGNPDPDWTRGALVGHGREYLSQPEAEEGQKPPKAKPITRYCLHGFASCREEAAGTWDFIVQTAMVDGPDVAQVFEQEPGASGKQAAAALKAKLAAEGIRSEFIPATGSKAVRATPLAKDAYDGAVDVLASGEAVADFLLEATRFRKDGSGSGHDDTIDSAAGARNAAASRARWTWDDLLAKRKQGRGQAAAA